MESYQSSELFQELQEKLKMLFKRENVCCSTYFYNRTIGKLTIPLYLVLQETSIAKMQLSQDMVTDGLRSIGLVNVKENAVKIIQHPTLKINVNSCEAFKELQRILEDKQVLYQISKRVDTDQYINFTVFGKDISWFRKVVEHLENPIQFNLASLSDDIQFGVERIRKLKKDHAKISRNSLGKVHYSLQSPPEVFVRRAVETSSQEQQVKQVQKKTAVKDKGRFRQKKAKKEFKPKFTQDDFPSLQ